MKNVNIRKVLLKVIDERKERRKRIIEKKNLT